MPSNRRIRVVTLLVILAVIVTLYITSAARQSQTNPFYIKTADALAAQRAAKEARLGNQDHAGASGDNSVAARLKEAEEAAKKAADKKAEDFHGEKIVDTKKKEAEVMDVKKKIQDDIKEKASQAKDALEGGAAAVKEAVLKETKNETPEEAEARKVKDELNSILKRSPIIIFSKSYCRFSKKAKHIILDLYSITPAPFVVELDLNPLGAQLQAELAERTGRRTVPNVLINGKSIGGGDDVEGLHLDNKLIETIKSLGGKRMEVSKRE